MKTYKQLKFREWDKRKKVMFLPSYELAISFNGIVIDTDEQCDYENQSIILMQFTGLLDKNGKEIYEGDIMQRNKGNKYEVLEGCSMGSIYIKVERTIFSELLNEDTAFEVLGNVFENPKLLTK